MHPTQHSPGPTPLAFAARLGRAVSPAAWRARRERKRRFERLLIEREVERRRRYYCRRLLGGLDAAVGAIEAEMAAASVEDLVALTHGAEAP